MEINMLLGVLQVVILVFQCVVAFNEYKKNKSEKKGVLQICYSNIPNKRFEHSTQDWRYNLEDLISFRNIGDDFVFIKKTEIIVDDEKRINNKVPDGMMLSYKEDFNAILIDFQLSQLEKNKDKIKVSVIFDIKNSNNYTYEQKIDMKFIKNIEFNYWELDSYNWRME